MQTNGLPDGVKSTLSIDEEGNHHHRFYYAGDDGHYHALDIVLREKDIARARIDPDFYDKLQASFINDALNWYREAVNHSNGQER